MKMMNKYIIALLSLFVMIATSCRDESWHHDGPGEKYGTLSTKSIALKISGEENEIGRSDDNGEHDLSEFIVEILDGSTVIERYSYKDLPEAISLPVGPYSVKVRNTDVKEAAWEDPYYTGAQEFVIKENLVTEVETVVCKLSNIKVSIKVSDDLRQLMSDDCKLTVLANNVGELVYGLKEIDNATAGYFEYTTASNTLIATLTGTVDGKPLSLQTIYTDLAPGQHRIIYYSIKTVEGEDPENPGRPIEPTDPDDPDNPNKPEEPTDPEQPSNGKIEISNGYGLDVTVKIIDLNMKYPGEYYETIDGIIRPGDDDPDYTPPTTEPEDPKKPPVDMTDDAEKPTEPVDPEEPDKPDPKPEEPGKPVEPVSQIDFTSETLSFDKPNSTDIAPAIVVISSKLGLTNLHVKIESDNENFILSAGELLPLDFDLAHPRDDKEKNDFSSLGFPVENEVIGAKNLDFDITAFVPLLAAFPGNHTFTLTVTDEKGYTVSKILTIES
jgi:hypothetical protein